MLCSQVGAVVQRVAVLGDAIPQLLTTLAGKPEKENIKCIVQTLKVRNILFCTVFICTVYSSVRGLGAGRGGA